MSKQIKEVRALTLDIHSDFNKASKDPLSWATWATSNPIDSLKIWTEWVNSGKDVSNMASQWHPNLTKCGSFANALGYAIHLKLKYFYYADRNYATTPQRNSNLNNEPIGGSTIQSRPTTVSKEQPSDDSPIDNGTEQNGSVQAPYKARSGQS